MSYYTIMLFKFEKFDKFIYTQRIQYVTWEQVE